MNQLIPDEGKNLITRVISEIRGDMTDSEFAEALRDFTQGKLDLQRITIQKYRTGQNEPSFEKLHFILDYGHTFNRLSSETKWELINYFRLLIPATKNG